MGASRQGSGGMSRRPHECVGAVTHVPPLPLTFASPTIISSSYPPLSPYQVASSPMCHARVHAPRHRSIFNP